MDTEEFRFFQNDTDWKTLFDSAGLSEVAVALEEHAIEKRGYPEDEPLFKPIENGPFHRALKELTEHLTPDERDEVLLPHLVRLEEMACIRNVMDRFGNMTISETVDQASHRPFVNQIHALTSAITDAQMLAGLHNMDPAELANGIALEMEQSFRERLGSRTASQNWLDAIKRIEAPSTEELDKFLQISAAIDWQKTFKERGDTNSVAAGFVEFITEGRCQPRDHFDKLLVELPAVLDVRSIRHDCGHTNNPITHDHDIKNILLIRSVVEKFSLERVADAVSMVANSQLKQCTQRLANELYIANEALTGKRDRMAATTLAKDFTTQVEDAIRQDLSLPPRQRSNDLT